MSESLIVSRQHNGITIQQRRADQYIDATAMCKAYGKRWHDYWRLDSTQELVAALASEAGIPASQLVEARKGNSARFQQGTFIHPDLAIQLAQWCNPLFAIQVSRWIRELIATGRVEVAPEARQQGHLAVYSERLRACWPIREKIPDGYWCVFIEAADLLIDAEAVCAEAGLEMDRFDLLDGSVGKRYVAFREGKLWAGERVQYQHVFPAGDRRGTQLAWAYPLSELQHFRPWLHKVYVRVWFADYLQRKYGPAQLIRALPAFRRRGIPITLPDTRPFDE